MKEAYIMVHEDGWKPTFIKMSEGTGDNLWQEDIDEGFVDYIMYDTYEVGVEDWEFEFKEDDGGMILLEKLCADMTMEEFIKRTLDFIYFDENGNPCEPSVKYEVIESHE